MKFFTYSDYIKSIHSINVNNNLAIKEDEITYKLTEQNNKKLDKIYNNFIKTILNNEEEISTFIRIYFRSKKKKELIKVDSEILENKTVIYKEKTKNIFFLLMYITKIDTNIPYTVLRYCMEVIRSWKKSNKMNKNAIYPVIIPIIIYSGKEEWNIFMNFKRVETKLTTFEKNKVELGYNFIALNKMLKSSVLYNCNTIQKLVLIESIKTI